MPRNCDNISISAPELHLPNLLKIAYSEGMRTKVGHSNPITIEIQEWRYVRAAKNHEKEIMT